MNRQYWITTISILIYFVCPIVLRAQISDVNNPPTGQITSTYKDWERGTIPIQANAADEDGQVTSVQFQYSSDNTNWANIGPVITKVPYMVSWDTSGIDVDPDVWVRAVITDDDKATTEVVIARSFGIDNQLPTFANWKLDPPNVTENSNQSFLRAEVEITDKGSGVDDTKVQIDYHIGNSAYIGYRGMFKGSDNTWFFEIPRPLGNWSSFAGQDIIYKVKVYDKAGNFVESQEQKEFIDPITFISINITVESKGNGSISPSGEVRVVHGKDQTFIIKSDANYHVLDVLVDGKSAGAVAEYTFTSVTSDHTISATFAIDTYTTTAESKGNGSISPPGEVKVEHGKNQTFIIKPDANYHILDVLVDGKSVGALAEYLFSNVVSNHTISAAFASDIHCSDDYDGKWKNEDFVINLKCDVTPGINGADVKYRVNDGAVRSLSSDGQPRIDTEGDNKLEYWGVDRSGYEENRRVVSGIKLDKTRPVVSDWSQEPSKLSSDMAGSLRIKIRAEDNLSGVNTPQIAYRLSSGYGEYKDMQDGGDGYWYSDVSETWSEHPDESLSCRIRLEDKAGNTLEDERQVKIEIQLPQAPSGLMAIEVDGAVEISWSSSTSAGITGYNIYCASPVDSVAKKINPEPVKGLTYKDRPSGHRKTYCYCVTALSPSGESSKSEVSEVYFLQPGVVEVFPGDTDNDGRVSILDIFPVGMFWDKNGEKREPQDINWEMGITPSKGWVPVESAYADADGNGVINAEDVLVIASNWGRKHEINLSPDSVDPQRLLSDKDMLDKYREMYEVLEKGESMGAAALRASLKEIIDRLKPQKSLLLANYPNPCNPDTWIPFVLSEGADTGISIYNSNGILIRKLELGVLEAGYYIKQDKAAHWDGRNEAGEKVASGVYFYTIQAGDYKSVKKMVVAR